MANPWITDLNHLLEAEKAAAPRKATRLRGHLTAIVKAATALAARRERETALRCRGTRRKPCSGKLRVRLQDIPSEIHWRCPSCGEKGVILNWPNSPWDLSGSGQLSWDQSSPRCTVLVAENHFHELCRIEFMDPDSERAVFSAQPKGGKVALSGSALVFEDILGELAAEANYESRKARQKRLDRLLQSLNGNPNLNSALAVNGGGAATVQERQVSAAGAAASLPASAQMLEDASREWCTGGVRELDQYLSELPQTLQSPNPGAAELSPFQLHSLLTADWQKPETAVQLCSKLPAEDIDGCTILRNSLPFLAACGEANGLQATAAGNLNRRFVVQMIQRLPLAEPWRNKYKQFRKVWNEADFFYLHLLRRLCCLAGLIELRQRRFHLTSFGRQCLRPADRGRLFSSLFQAFFQRFDLSLLDRLPDNRTLQATIAFSFYALRRQDDSWTPSRLLVSRLLLPAARAASSSSLIDYELRQTESRILGPLSDFGLLELRPLEASRTEPSAFQVRKTPLYDRFFSWSL